MVPLSWCIDVFGLGEACELVLVARQAAEEDPTADGEDGGPPAEAIGPGVVIVALEDQVIELDWVDDEGNELNDHSDEEQGPNDGQQADVEGAAEGDTGDDESDDEDDEADDH